MGRVEGRPAAHPETTAPPIGQPTPVRNSVSALDFRRGYGYIPRMRLHVNGRPREVTAADHESLLTTLRERLALTGTKLACERGECGACTVLVDGEPVYACLALTHAYAGAVITTIEGLAGGPGSGALHPVQRAFIDCDAVQCGYCTPGQVLAAVALLTRSPQPGDAEITEAMTGHLCRCGTYPKIAQAIRVAASALAERAPAP